MGICWCFWVSPHPSQVQVMLFFFYPINEEVNDVYLRFKYAQVPQTIDRTDTELKLTMTRTMSNLQEMDKIQQKTPYELKAKKEITS